MRSELPPGANGTTIVMFFDGNAVCAATSRTASTAIVQNNVFENTRHRVIAALPSEPDRTSGAARMNRTDGTALIVIARSPRSVLVAKPIYAAQSPRANRKPEAADRP